MMTGCRIGTVRGLAGAAAVVLVGVASAGQPPAQPAAPPAERPLVSPGAQPSVAAPGDQPVATPTPPVPAPVEREVTYGVDLAFLHALAGDIDGGGEVSVSRAGAWLGIGVPIADYHLLSIEMSSEFSFYSFDNAVGLDPVDGDPFGTVGEFRVGTRLFIRQAVRWGWFVAGDITSAGELGAGFSDTLTFGTYGGARYWFSEGLSMSGGLSARTRLEEEAFIMPFVTIDWTINDQWGVRTSQHVLERGMNVSVIYSATDALALSVGAGYMPREYRLDSDGFAPEGSVVDSRFGFMGGATWKITPAMSLHGGLGVNFSQEFTIRNSNGDEVSQNQTDPQPFATLGLEFKF